MTKFDTDLTPTERQAAISRRATLKNKVTGATWTTDELDALNTLTLLTLRLLIDQPQLTADGREYSRALNASGVPNAPEYRHEFLMAEDADYNAAWSYDHALAYTTRADLDPALMQAVTRGRDAYPYREADPVIVDRSLLRNGYRQLREGESHPPPVVGSDVPTNYPAETLFPSDTLYPA